MKRILITGANSYIGTNVERWLLKENIEEQKYSIDTLDMLDANWKQKDFSGYDVVFHVAGIAHQKETKDNAKLYFEINEELAVSVAENAKSGRVKHFIILSSMSVYGLEKGHITKETIPSPKTNYGKAKYNADKRIAELEDETFRVAYVRPPMVYGNGCKGNYQMLRKFALMSPVFPAFSNKRSMIYIENLAKFIQNVIDAELSGIFFPQDSEYVNTSKMVYEIAKCNEKKCVLTRIFIPLILLGKKLNVTVVNKVFGDLTYERCDIVFGKTFQNIITEIERN